MIFKLIIQNRCWGIRCEIALRWLPQSLINTLRPRENGRHFADDIFKWIFVNENLWIPIKISSLFPRVQFNNIPALVQIMAWRRPGDKPLSEPMMVRLPTHICVTRPQLVNEKPTLIPVASEVPSGNKSLPEPMLSQIYVNIWRQ